MAISGPCAGERSSKGNEAMASGLATRVARLEYAYRDERAQRKRKNDMTKLSRMKDGERQERMKVLSERITKRRGIEPARGESVLDAAVRSLSQGMRTTD